MNDYRVESLSDLATAGRGNFVDGNWIESPFIAEEGIRFIQTGNVGVGKFVGKNKRFISEESFRKLKCTEVKAGDVLICRLADPIGRACLAPADVGRMVTSVDVVIMRPDPKKVDVGYLTYVLNSDEQLAASADVAGGSTRQRISRTQLGRLNVRLPNSIDEQRRIAELLSTLDEQIEQTEAESKKLAELIPGAFDDLFGEGLSEGLSIKALKSGKLKNGWSRLPVSTAAQQILDFRGRTPLKLGMQWGGGDIPALSANNVEMGQVNFEKESYFASDALYKKWMTQGDCQKNDVLMTLEAPLGNVALVPDGNKYILSQRVILLKPKAELLSGPYLHLYMRWRWFQALLKEESTGTTATGIQRRKLERLPVLIAPETERNLIVEFLSGLLSQQSILLDELNKLQIEKQGLVADILTGKKRLKAEISGINL